ncbi:acetoacetate decarboxylase family protein [Winogradskyella ursingii]|uniref:acetoacetate decarboxylase family protein n=1 Tax=Winogradskyella ursingii TaxID=2686079 RepID=UPI0015CCD107|nr:acetoacetate decarboxylase family protein [Winogradskyella ursingii]
MSNKVNQERKPITQNSIDESEPLYGKCDGRFVFISVTSAFAQSLLPKDLTLASQDYTPAGKHPLLLMYNDTWLHSNPFLEKMAKKHNLDLDLHYNEFIVMLPYVKFKDDNYNEDAPFCFLPVLYLDSWLAVLGGRIFWEFNKKLARFTTDGPIYEIRHELSKNLYLTSEFTDSAEPPVLGRSLSNFEAITPILQLPVLEYGVIGYITSIYKVGFENQYISPFNVKGTNHTSSYLPKGMFQSSSIESNVMGSFIMQYQWSLSYAKFIKF